MAYLFDTDAISELLRPRPLAPYLEWLRTIAREDQFTSAVTVGELFKGAYRSTARDRHRENVEAAEAVRTARNVEGSGSPSD